MSQATITIEGVEMDVEYVYNPKEAQTLEHEGCPASIEVEQIFIGGVDVSDLIFRHYSQRIINAIYSL